MGQCLGQVSEFTGLMAIMSTYLKQRLHQKIIVETPAPCTKFLGRFLSRIRINRPVEGFKIQTMLLEAQFALILKHSYFFRWTHHTIVQEFQPKILSF